MPDAPPAGRGGHLNLQLKEALTPSRDGQSVRRYGEGLPRPGQGDRAAEQLQRVPRRVIPLTMGSWMMLQRNLLYTGITRAKRLLVLAGSRRLATACAPKAETRDPPTQQ